MHPSIRLYSRIEPVNAVLVAAWPGMGNVAFGAASYLRENLKAVKFADIEPEDVFYQTGVQIREGLLDIPGLPQSEFYFYRDPEGRNDIIIFIGESQPVMEKEYELARRVVEVAVLLKVNELITFAATPVNITHRSEPGVWGVATDGELLSALPSLGVKVMDAGHIGGLNGLLLGVGKESGIHGICLLGEIPFYTAKIENPKSSLAILKVFMKYKHISLGLDGLTQMAHFVEEEVEKVSKTTKQTFFGNEEAGDSKQDYESGKEETETVTDEVRKRIERLFEAAAEDISKAGELKRELDRWSLFVEYEDRFLDLFGRKNL